VCNAVLNQRAIEMLKREGGSWGGCGAGFGKRVGESRYEWRVRNGGGE